LKVRPKEVTTIRRLQLVNLKIYTYETETVVGIFPDPLV